MACKTYKDPTVCAQLFFFLASFTMLFKLQNCSYFCRFSSYFYHILKFENNDVCTSHIYQINLINYYYIHFCVLHSRMPLKITLTQTFNHYLVRSEAFVIVLHSLILFFYSNFLKGSSGSRASEQFEGILFFLWLPGYWSRSS